MGGLLSSFFQSGSALLNSNHRQLSEQTSAHIQFIFDALRANPRLVAARLQPVLSQISKGENILQVHNEEGYNLLQKCVGINNQDMVRWILSRNLDVNRGVCSLPLHIACLKGYEDCVELLLKHGARIDVEARMCWPGPRCHNCEQRGKYSSLFDSSNTADQRSSDRLQSAVYYAIDGDQVEILELLTQQGEDHWLPWQQRRPLLHIACERGAWNCVQYLVSERSDEINQCFDEYYPIHQAALHHVQFVERLIVCGADTMVRTSTQQLTLLHVVYLLGKKSVNDTMQTTKLLLDHGLRDLINEPDSLGNTPLHALIVRYALEEARFGYDHDPTPWTKWDTLHLVRFLLQNGAAPSINQPGNSALACVLRHVKDWEFRYELLDMLLQNGGNPNIVGRDGSVPLMVCLVPLINKDPLHHFTHTMKIFYLNCVRLLCRYGANPNCSSRSNLTPLHVLMFTASENVALSREQEKAHAFDFIRQLLTILLQHGLEPNVRFSQRSHHILVSVVDMVGSARSAADFDHIYELLLTLLQFGADPNVVISGGQEPKICHSQSSVFLKKSSHRVLYLYVQRLVGREDLLLDPERRFERVIRLFCRCMEHAALYPCLRLLHTQSTVAPIKWQLAAVLRRLQTHPRSLKQICRQSIYCQLQHRPGMYATKLPLPPQLREYLLSFAE